MPEDRRTSDNTKFRIWEILGEKIIPDHIKFEIWELSEQKKIPDYIKFVCGGTAGMMATCFVHPLDVIKNRMQLSAKERATSSQVINGILKNEGLLAFYNGLSAGLLRQATYTTARLGIYTWLFEAFTGADNSPPGFGTKAVLAMGAGVAGAFVGTPAEVILIRMTADGRLPPAERRNYANAIHALYRIAKEEGWTTLWRGAVPTMGRAMIVNAAQLASYSQAKQFLIANNITNDNLACHFGSALISGMLTTIASMPADICKTRIQNMKMIDGKPEYSGVVDVFSKIIRNEGIFALWKGFIPYYARVGPHTILTFIFLEQLNNAYKTYVLGLSVKQ